MTISREKLYEEVWSEPMTTVARRYGVSSSYLARVCDQLDVPRPPRGYWQQLAAGLKVKQPTLVPPRPGAALAWTRDGTPPERQPLSAPTLLKKERPKQPSEGSPPAQHPLLVGAQGHFAHARERGFRDHYIRPYKRKLVDLFVSPDLLDRALAATNELFLALEARRLKVLLAPAGMDFHHTQAWLREGQEPNERTFFEDRWSPVTPTLVLVGEVAFGINVFETSEEVDVRYDDKQNRFVRAAPAAMLPAKARRALARVLTERPSRHWLPSGRLGLRAYAPFRGVAWERTWYESSPGELPGLAATIARELRRAAPTITALREEQRRKDEEEQRRWDAEREARQKREEEERRQREAQARREEVVRQEKELEERVGLWRLAHDIRAYVAEARALVAEAHSPPGAERELAHHLAWAASVADRLDPLRSLREKLAQQPASAGPSCDSSPGAPEQPPASQQTKS